MERMSEAAWGNDVGGVSIIDSERRNMTNVEATGTIVVDGTEYWFHLRDGDVAGTELVGWDDQGVGIVREPYIPTTLVPHRNQVMSAIADGTAQAFLDRWDKDLDPSDERGRVLSRLPSSAAYDAFFAPGTGASLHHHKVAASHGYAIDDEPAAVALRRLLLDHLLAVAPPRRDVLNGDAASTLRAWMAASDPDTETGRRIEALRAGVVDRMASGKSRHPTHEERQSLLAFGYCYCSPRLRDDSRYFLVRSLLGLEPLAGFDRRALPESPFAEMLRILDPSLVRSTKVDQAAEGRGLLDSLAMNMARCGSLALPEIYANRAAALGYSLHFNFDPALPAPERHADPEEVSGP